MKKAVLAAGFLQLFSVLISAGSYDPYSVLRKKTKVEVKAFQLWSPSFSGGLIPPKHTCAGANLSPQLEWSDPLLRTKSFAIICDGVDRRGKITTHWVMYRIPGNLRKLKEGVPNQTTLNDGSKQGINDYSKTGYTGPCPPTGTNKYIFTIFALDTSAIGASPAMTKAQLFKHLRGHILEQANLIGEYHR